MTKLDEQTLLKHVAPLLPKNPLSQTFFIARAAAIRAYASYEQSLLMLFAHLMGAQLDYAGIPFFKLNNARYRLAIIERMLHKRHGNQYNIFWNSLVALLKELDVERNHIVHWHIETTIDTDQKGRLTKIVMAPGNIFDRTPNTPQKTLHDLYEFTVQCDFLSRNLNVFYMLIAGHSDTWREICHQPVTYPPPDNHPLFQTPKAP